MYATAIGDRQVGGRLDGNLKILGVKMSMGWRDGRHWWPAAA